MLLVLGTALYISLLIKLCFGITSVHPYSGTSFFIASIQSRYPLHRPHCSLRFWKIEDTCTNLVRTIVYSGGSEYYCFTIPSHTEEPCPSLHTET